MTLSKKTKNTKNTTIDSFFKPIEKTTNNLKRKSDLNDTTSLKKKRSILVDDNQDIKTAEDTSELNTQMIPEGDDTQWSDLTCSSPIDIEEGKSQSLFSQDLAFNDHQHLFIDSLKNSPRQESVFLNDHSVFSLDESFFSEIVQEDEEDQELILRHQETKNQNIDDYLDDMDFSISDQVQSISESLEDIIIPQL